MKMDESGRSIVGKLFFHLLAPILQPLFTFVLALPPMNAEEHDQGRKQA
jgi:hypothetical protein